MAITLAEEKKSLNVKNFIFLFLAILLIVGVVWFFRTELKEAITKVPTSQAIVFPVVKSRSIINKDFNNNSVPLEMSRFILEGAKEKTLSRLKYADADQARILGFELAYKLDSENYNLKNIYETELAVAQKKGWKLLAANLESSTVFLDIGHKNSSADYKVRIFSENTGVQFAVIIQYLITRDLPK